MEKRVLDVGIYRRGPSVFWAFLVVKRPKKEAE
jgi:hypothetical protein